MKHFVCQSPTAGTTQLYGERFAQHLTRGGTLLLFGELGAGKTTFVQGVARGFGITQTITSPTFTLLQPYVVPNHSVIRQLVHVDLYRLTEPKQLQHLDLDYYAADPATVMLVEWPERQPQPWPHLLGEIHFSNADHSARQLDCRGQVSAWLV